MTQPNVYDLSTAAALREVVGALFLGHNYRLYTERETRNQLVEAYQSLLSILRDLPKDATFEEWMDALRSAVGEAKGGDLEWWLLGLGKKTADNLGVKQANRLDYLEEVGIHLRLLTEGQAGLAFEDAMLMLWAGAATLTIRGSQKSRVGKRLERVFLRAGLTILGLREGVDFWLGVPADAEVDREVDGEILTNRGRIRVDIGLIEAGNAEVIMDKIGRVDTNGIVICDRVGNRSNAPQVAANNRVAFIQIRNSRPLSDLYNHLVPLVDRDLAEPPTDEAGIRQALDNLPDEILIPAQPEAR